MDVSPETWRRRKQVKSLRDRGARPAIAQNPFTGTMAGPDSKKELDEIGTIARVQQKT
jgi:hypothetical protein